MATSQTVEADDLVRLCLQFLGEQGLVRSARVLAEESQVALNAVPDVQALRADVVGGAWAKVLRTVGAMRLPEALLQRVFEHVALELLEARDLAVAAELMQEDALQSLRAASPDRFARLERLARRWDSAAAFGGAGRAGRRAELADALADEVGAAAPGRLEALVGEALRWQVYQGSLRPGEAYDLFRDSSRRSRRDAVEAVPRRLAGSVKFGKRSHANAALFSGDGASLVSGSVDGFVELWDYDSCRLRRDLAYQAEDALLMHEAPVLSVGLSRDFKHLVSGSEDGVVCVWRVETGALVRRLPDAHSAAVACVAFSRNGMEVLSAAGSCVRVHGLKSKRVLREFRGHSSFVNSAVFSPDFQHVVTASSDGRVMVWAAKTAELVRSFSPPQPSATSELPLHSATFLGAHLLVCPHAPVAYEMSIEGEVLREFSGGSGAVAFTCAVASPQGRFVYCGAENGVLHAFATDTASLVSTLEVAPSAVIGMTHHPTRNLLATIAQESVMKVWRS